MGRWINRDPTGEEGGLNIYVFSLNSPTSSFDPLGLKGVKYILKKLKIRGSKEIAKQAGKKLADIIIVEEKYLTRFGDEILAYKPSKRDWFFHGIPDVSEVKLINGKMPRNAQFANTNILFDDPNLKWINDLGGIRITRSGVVDFGPFVPVGKGGAELKIKWFKDSFKNRGADRRMALQQMKDMLPEGFDESKYVLHHQGDYVMFVDRSLHKAVGHTGPIAWLKENIKTGCYVAVGFFVGWQYELGYEFFRETGEDFIDLTDQLGKYKQQKQDTLDSIQ